jgi:hypothetical protein
MYITCIVYIVEKSFGISIAPVQSRGRLLVMYKLIKGANMLIINKCSKHLP